jgi:glutamine cyclotransferase
LDKQKGKIWFSDGTSRLHRIDPSTLEMEDCIEVTDNDGLPVDRLNELEVVNGFIWANVFTENYIVKIDPETGKVVKKVDLSSIVDAEMKRVSENYVYNYDYLNNVLNGIAYDSSNDDFYVTGKRWNFMFKLKIN